MQDLLFLAHRIPYPPDKGDKITTWNLLRHLAENYRVHLGFFIDTPDDDEHVEKLKQICASIFWQRLSPRQARLRSLRCFLTGEPLTAGYYRDPRLAADVDRVVDQYRPSRFYIYCSAMAQYVMRRHTERYVLHLADIDSEKWRQYAETGRSPMRIVHQRESRLLLDLERRAARAANAVVFASRAEAAKFRLLAPESADKSCHVNNGVDTEYFDNSKNFPDYFHIAPAIVFVGVMDYFPNVQGVTWFVEKVMPLLRNHRAAPHFWIVGSNPAKTVRDLAGPDVHVTGRVPDIRPYLAHARAAVAPLQIARGVQNKVLEAMAMGLPTVVTPETRAGLDCRDDEILVAATPDQFAARLSRVLDGDDPTIGVRARARVATAYTWEASFAAVDRLLEGNLGEAEPATAPAHRLVAT